MFHQRRKQEDKVFDFELKHCRSIASSQLFECIQDGIVAFGKRESASARQRIEGTAPATPFGLNDEHDAPAKSGLFKVGRQNKKKFNWFAIIRAQERRRLLRDGRGR